MDRVGKSIRELPSVEERDAALHALGRLLVTTWGAPFDALREPLTALAERGVAGALACLTTGVWIAFVQAPRATQALADATLSILQRHATNALVAACWAALVAAVYSSEDIRDIVAPESSWLCDAFMHAETLADQVGLGAAVGMLLCATRATHGASLAGMAMRWAPLLTGPVVTESAASFAEGRELAAYLPLDDVLDFAHGIKGLKNVLAVLESGEM